ncbi:MAG: hypothetical protein V2J65_17100 [Desulfobacteraceae bacterium]|jgi:hypothetical protein|nr:hypothetical protein [Desulfobacteraceae bacterium]
MQHWKLLELIETDIESMDLDHLKRVCLLLQSDLWWVGSRLDDRDRMEPDRIVELEGDRDRVKRAIGKIEKRIEALD